MSSNVKRVEPTLKEGRYQVAWRVTDNGIKPVLLVGGQYFERRAIVDPEHLLRVCQDEVVGPDIWEHTFGRLPQDNERESGLRAVWRPIEGKPSGLLEREK